MKPRETWFDDAAGPLVRPFAVTRGRTHAHRHDLEMITLVVALEAPSAARTVEPEHARVLEVCEQPQSVAEIAARVDLPLCVVKVLISDLIDRKRVAISAADWGPSVSLDMNLMQRVLDGIRNL